MRSVVIRSGGFWFGVLYFLQSLHFVHSGDFPQADDDLLEVLQVGNIQNNFDAGLTVCRMCGDVADVALGVPDHAGDVFQHTEAVVAEDCQLHGISSWSAVVAGPFDIDFSFRLIEKICHVRTIDGVHCDALAACDVTDDVFAADWITTAGAVDQHVSLAAHGDGVVVSEDAADNAGDTAGLRRQAFRFDVPRNRRSCTSGQQACQNLPRGVLAVADARHQVLTLAETVSRSYAQ